MEAKKWTVIGAASVLGVGLAAGGAVAAANAMTLSDRSGEVAPVSGIRVDDRENDGAVLPGTSGSSTPSASSPSAGPSPSAPPGDSSSDTWSANSASTAVSAPSTVTPPSPATPSSPVSPTTPPSPVSPASAPSIPSVD